MAGSKLESQFLFLWRVAQGPALEREVKFHPTRKWLADFGHLESRTLIEIEGGIFTRAGGRHNRGGGYAKDAEKHLEAALAGNLLSDGGGFLLVAAIREPECTPPGQR